VLILTDILEEHADEAAFLYAHRRLALGSLTLTAPDLAEFDDRLLAHLDGLLLGGEDARKLLAGDFSGSERERQFLVSWLALAGEDEGRLRAAIEAAEAAAPAAFAGAVDAWNWAGGPRAESAARALLAEPSPRRRRLGLVALAGRRLDPGEALRPALRDDDPALRAAAAVAAGELRRLDLAGDVARIAQDADAQAAAAAAGLATLAGGAGGAEGAAACLAAGASPLLEAWGLLAPEAARAWARGRVSAGGADAPAALHFLGLCGHLEDAGAFTWGAGTDDAGLRRAACLGAAALGSPAAVPWLRAALADPLAASLAGWTLRRILGDEAVPAMRPPDPAAPGAAGAPPGPAAAAAAEEDEADDAGPAGAAAGEPVEPPESPEPLAEAGAWDGAAFDGWWSAHGRRFRPDARLRSGAAWQAGPPRAGSPLWCRHEEAFEEALADPRAPRRETRAIVPCWSWGGGLRA